MSNFFGKEIVENEQGFEERAKYGKSLLNEFIGRPMASIFYYVY